MSDRVLSKAGLARGSELEHPEAQRDGERKNGRGCVRFGECRRHRPTRYQLPATT